MAALMKSGFCWQEKKRKVGIVESAAGQYNGCKTNYPQTQCIAFAPESATGRAQWRQFVSVLFGVRLEHNAAFTWLVALQSGEGSVGSTRLCFPWCQEWELNTLDVSLACTWAWADKFPATGDPQAFYLFPCALSRTIGGFSIAGLLTHVSSRRIPRYGLRERQKGRERRREGGRDGGRERKKQRKIK